MVPPSTEVCIQVKNLSFRPKATIFPHPPSLYLYGIEHHEFFPLLIGSGGGHLVHRSCLSVWRPHRLWPGRLLCPWDFPGKNTEVGCHVLLQGIFPTQGSNPHLLHWQADSSTAGPPRKPWDAYSQTDQSTHILGNKPKNG